MFREWIRSQPAPRLFGSCDRATAPYSPAVRIIARRILREFWEKHPDARVPIETWYHDAKRADWKSPSDIKRVYRNASFVANNRVVFNLKGNDYRLVVAIQYRFGIVYVRFIGSHARYDEIDAATV